MSGAGEASAMSDARADSIRHIQRRLRIQRRLTWMATIVFTITMTVGGGSALLGLAIWFDQPIRTIGTHGMLPASYGSILYGLWFGAIALLYLFFSPFAFLAARAGRVGRAATVVLSLPFLFWGPTNLGLWNAHFDFGALVVSVLAWSVLPGFGSVLLAHAIALHLLSGESPRSEVTPTPPVAAPLRAWFSCPATGAALIFAIAATVYVLRLTTTEWLKHTQYR
jgi:hypothetical protein